LVICSDTVVECVRLPLVPVMVMVNTPVAVLGPLPVNVRVDVPLPPVTLVGLKVAVTPVGSELVESVTVPLNPLSDVIVTVVDVEPPLDIVRLEGEALMLKSPAPGVLTVRLYAALWDRDPLVPVTVMVYDPVGVLAAVEIVNVLVYVGVPLVGFTVAVRPVAVGLMLVLSVTVWLVPLTRLTVTVEVVPDP
jgi:hypothetical protein